MRTATLGALLLWTTALPAQEARRLLEKARIVEKQEGDLKRAVELFRQASAAVDGGSELEATALHELGLCLLRMGRQAEARLMLAQAAKGEGEGARRAKALLQGGSEQQDQIQRRVEMLIRQLHESDKAQQDLLWIGEPAAPQIAKAIEERKLDVAFVSRAVRVLLQIGGKTTQAFLDRVRSSKDTLLRRAVVRGFGRSRGADAGDERLRQAMLAFLDDPDVKVRREVLHRIGGMLSPPKLLELGRSPTPEMRADSLKLLRRRSRWQSDGDMGGHLDGLLSLLEKAFDDENEDVRMEAAGFWKERTVADTLFQVPEGRRVFLRWLARADRTLTTRRFAQVPTAPFADPPPPDSVVACAQQLDRVPEAPSWRHHDLHRFAKLCLPGWNAQAMPHVLELVALGYDRLQPVYEAWVREHARPEHDARIVALLPHFRDAAKLLDLVAKRMKPALVPPLEQQLESALGRGPANAEEPGHVARLAYAISRIRTQATAGYLLDLVRRQPWLWRTVASSLLEWERPEAHLATLLTLADAGRKDVATLRNRLFFRVVQGTLEDAGPALAAAYGFALRDFSSPEDAGLARRNVTGIQCLFVVKRSDNRAWPHGYTSAQLARILDICLQTGNAQVWNHLRRILGSSAFRVPGPALEVVCKRVPACPNADVRRDIVRYLLQGEPVLVPAADALAKQMLESEDRGRRLLALMHMQTTGRPEFVPLIVPLLEDPDVAVVGRALYLLAKTGDPAVADVIAARLRSDRPRIRKEAVTQLVRLMSAAALPQVLPLLEDSDASVRAAVVRACHETLDKKAVPGLLAALKDKSSMVRELAERALKAIRYFHEQQAHWQKAFRNLGAASAAEALMKQTGEDQPAKVRLAAIGALGVLGDPQALPFLIELMKSDDKEIAAEAEAAVQSLHQVLFRK